MPTRQYQRVWCKTCNEFTLHPVTIANDNGKELQCSVCDTEYSAIYLRDIPEDKLIVQRKRYTDSKKASTDRAMNIFLRGGYGAMGGNPLEDLFRETWSEKDVYESDAGQAAIDKQDKKEREAVREIRRAQREEDFALAVKYSKLGRNDICICGKLGENNKPLKYKKCCLRKITEIKNKMR